MKTLVIINFAAWIGEEAANQETIARELLHVRTDEFYLL
jgi:hypothetical protein